MRSIEDLVAAVERSGVSLWLDDLQLRYRGRSEATSGAEFQEVRDRKLEVIDHLLKRRSVRTFPPLIPSPRPAELPLSLSQVLWTNLEREYGPALSHLSMNFVASGRLDVALLSKCVRQVMDRHEILRTRYNIDAVPVTQEVMPPMDPEIEIVDLSGQSGEAQEEAIYERLRGFRERRISLSDGCGLKIHIIELGPDRRHLTFTVHHVAMDEASSEIFQVEVWSLYAALSSGNRVAPPALPMQYADYAVWEQKWLSGAGLSHYYRFWEDRLAGVAPLDLPKHRERPPAPDNLSAIGTREITLDETLWARMIDFAKHEGLTAPMVILGVFGAMLRAWTSQDRIVVGYVIHGRAPGLDHLIGCFIRTRPLYLDLSGDPTFLDLMRAARRAYVDATDLRNATSAKVWTDVRLSQVTINLPGIRYGELPNRGTDGFSPAEGLHLAPYEPPRPLVAEIRQDLEIIGATVRFALDWISPADVDWFVNEVPAFFDRALGAPGDRLSRLVTPRAAVAKPSALAAALP